MSGELFPKDHQGRSPTAEELAVWVAAAWGPGAAAAIETGRRLLAAKAQLRGGGEFGRLFADHEHRVLSSLPFGSRTGERLMAIARHPVIGDPTRVSDLPSSWATLAELSRLPPERVEAGLVAGWIHPGLQRDQATGPAPAADERTRSAAEVTADEVEVLVVATLPGLDGPGLEYLCWRLESLASRCRRGADEGPR